MCTLLGQSPQDLGYAAVEWTVPLLQEHLQRCTDQWFSADTVRRELQRQCYVWKRARYVWTPTPSWRKKRRIRRQIRHLRPRSVLLAEDETDLLLFPLLRIVRLVGPLPGRLRNGPVPLADHLLILLPHVEAQLQLQQMLRPITTVQSLGDLVLVCWQRRSRNWAN